MPHSRGRAEQIHQCEYTPIASPLLPFQNIGDNGIHQHITNSNFFLELRLLDISHQILPTLKIVP